MDCFPRIVFLNACETWGVCELVQLKLPVPMCIGWRAGSVSGQQCTAMVSFAGLLLLHIKFDESPSFVRFALAVSPVLHIPSVTIDGYFCGRRIFRCKVCHSTALPLRLLVRARFAQ